MRLFKDYLLLAYLAAIFSALCAFPAAAESTAIKSADAFIRENITAPGAGWVITDGSTTLSGTV